MTLLRLTGAQPYLKQADIGVAPVTVAQLAAWLNMTDPATISTASANLRMALNGCIDEAEKYTKREFWNKRFVTYRDVFGDDNELPKSGQIYPCQTNEPICIRKSPLNVVESITYYDENNALQTLDPSLYRVVIKEAYSMIYPVDTWVATYPRQQGITITFTAGYTSFPNALADAVLHHAANYYMNRGDCGCECKSAPDTSQAAYRQYRIEQVG